MANTLFLRLEGPMQSWGERARWSVRDTAPEPTKSGIVGLLACALGWNQDDDLRNLSLRIRVGVRCDKPGTRLVDFHTVGGGSKEPMLLTAEGKPKYIPNSKTPHTEPTYRAYLSDASFFVAIQADQQIIAQLENALQNPVWPFYLGRKSCPPAAPVFAGTGIYPNLREALAQDLPKADTRIVLECLPDELNAVRRRDEVDSHTHRTFLPRYAKDEALVGLGDGKDAA
jgi:CRISPR system Cascade subunit CasD